MTVQERAQIASRYEVWNSVVAVQRLWRTVKGSNAKIRQEIIKNYHSKLLTTVSVTVARKSGCPSTFRSEENVALVRNMFTRSPRKSTSQAARESGLSRHTVRTVLKKDLNFHPRKPHYMQELTPEDCDRRMEYGELMLSWHEDWQKLFENILWCDEAVFNIGSIVNRHNFHYWAAHDPEVTVEKIQNRPKVTVWCGMTSTRVIGPYLLFVTMNAERYLQMLEDYVWPILSGWENIDELVFVHDGAPPHFALSVRAWLYQKFLGRWLGLRGTHEWPARSRDLSPGDVLLWGWAKEEVYRAKPRTMEQLEERIRNVITNVPHDFLQKTVDSVPGGLRKLVDAAGAYIEF